MTRARSASPELRQELRALADRPLSEDEIRARRAIPVSEEERRETLALVDWFCRRYPTPAERLAYVRAAYKRWTRQH